MKKNGEFLNRRERGFVNGQAGRVNGLTNGNGKINGTGMINGLTNGNGKTNGLVNGNGTNGKPPSSQNGKIRIIKLAAFGIFLMMIFGVVAVSTNLMMKNVDWSMVKKYTDEAGDVTYAGVDITEYAFHMQGGMFCFYLKFAGNFISPDDTNSYAVIFIDNDTNPSTGYNAGDGIGADYIVLIRSVNNTVFATFEKFAGATNESWKWDTVGGVALTQTSNVVSGMLTEPINSNAKFKVIAERGYVMDKTPVVGIERSALLVTQTPLSNNTLKVVLKPLYGGVRVNSISFSVEPSTVTLTGPVSGTTLSIGEDIVSEKIYYIGINTANANNATVKVHINGVSVENDVPVTVWGKGFVKYVGTPSTIIIDGAFEDWDYMIKENKVYLYTDSTDDVEDKNINIYQDGYYNGSSSEFFYISVLGTMLNGNIAPLETKQSIPAPGLELTKKPYDYARIVIHTTTGETHVIEIYGVNGHVKKILMDGVETTSVKAAAGKDGLYGALEIELMKNMSIESYSVEMTDWNGLVDIAGPHVPSEASKGSSGITPLPEFHEYALIPLIAIVTLFVIRRRRH